VNAISADLKDGVLTVTIPKSTDRGTRRIDVT
jgi:HSP20 family molecular chaperone IbpA